jgi:hypothetical protein
MTDINPKRGEILIKLGDKEYKGNEHGFTSNRSKII